MRWAGDLRHELSIRGQQIATTTRSLHELTAAEPPSVIFGRTENHRHGNFYPASYRNICANPEWGRRLAKVHTGSRRASPRAGWRWRELDCANSSDALLMNIFCCRRRVVNRIVLHAGSAFGTNAAVWIQAWNPPSQRQDGPHRDRHENRRSHGRGQAHGNGFSESPGTND